MHDSNGMRLGLLQELMDAPLKGHARTLRKHGNPRMRRTTVPGGHALPIGSGPGGESCGTCAHLVKRQFAKTYLKCGKARAKWTGGRATDVLSRDPACGLWEKGVAKVEWG